MLDVPTISRFFGISITMHFDDHGPPHFHAHHPYGAAKVWIGALEIVHGEIMHGALDRPHRLRVSA